MTYPKRLIEVDLPIKRISAHARREKTIARGRQELEASLTERPLENIRLPGGGRPCAEKKTLR